MAVTNITGQPRRFFNVKNILGTVANQEHYCSNITYFADTFETTSATNPFPAGQNTVLTQPAYRTIKITNLDLTSVVYVFLNGDRSNYIAVQPGDTETLGLNDHIFYRWFSIETKAIVPVGKILIEGRC